MAMSHSFDSFGNGHDGDDYGQQMPGTFNDYDMMGNEDSHHDARTSGGFSFLKVLTGDKKLKADGQPAKRRGPKPDSKPAVTRRQELNRQAQRTHRERKETYIKQLEQEIHRFKDTIKQFARERDTAALERDAYAEENRQLKEILHANNISFGGYLQNNHQSPPGGYGSSASFTGSNPNHPSASTAPSSPPQFFGHSGSNGGHAPQQQQMTMNSIHSTQSSRPFINYDEHGQEFVLRLERPCMDHMQMLCVKSDTAEEDISSGHALMATCPPGDHLRDHPEVQYPHCLPEMKNHDLRLLLDFSNRLALGPEITPIMAWAQLLRHPSIKQLSADDLDALREELATKVNCYGFGAVLEQFEVEDAVQNVLAIKYESRPLMQTHSSGIMSH